ncbi:MAG: ABC transporter ATP-binding protein [Acidimicrobiia bacterium]|nr:ABC transporter ATP-binding protein [Acidimicrobiia bacterium]
MTTTTSSEPAIRLVGLTKRYRTHVAVDDLSMEVPSGSVTGFIGPNGAGKTTTMAMMLGLVKPTTGTGRVLGVPLDEPARFLPRVGALIEGPALYPALTGRENLRLLAELGRRDRDGIDAVLQRVGLADRGDDRFKDYSLGMKQRLGVAAALLADPELLVLDEPTNGLDPAGMHEVRRLIADIAAEGRTVFVSSHLLSEIEQICTWLVMINRGREIYSGPADEFIADAGTTISIVPERDDDTARLEVLLREAGYAAERTHGRLTVTFDDGPSRALTADINRRAHDAGVVIAELAPQRTNLEHHYLQLIEGVAS